MIRVKREIVKTRKMDICNSAASIHYKTVALRSTSPVFFLLQHYDSSLSLNLE